MTDMTESQRKLADMPTLVGNLQTPAREVVREVRHDEVVTTADLAVLAEWLYWQYGQAHAHLRWTVSTDGALVSVIGEHEEGVFTIVPGVDGPVVRQMRLTPGSLFDGKRWTLADLRQDIADRQAEVD